METMAAPMTEIIAASFPFPLNALGIIAEQAALYEIWNVDKFGQQCTDFVDDFQRKYSGKNYSALQDAEKCEVYNAALSTCTDLGFAPSSPCKHPLPPPLPPDPPEPSRCSGEGQVCLAKARQSGHCDADDECLPDAIDCSDCDQTCRVDGVTGVCGDGPGPSGSCGECMPLDAPLCSTLGSISKSSPQYCEDAPHWDQTTQSDAKAVSMRQACAPVLEDKPWQCHLQTPECPPGMQKCYWDGKWDR